jgi:hypothetical protein
MADSETTAIELFQAGDVLVSTRAGRVVLNAKGEEYELMNDECRAYQVITSDRNSRSVTVRRLAWHRYIADVPKEVIDGTTRMVTRRFGRPVSDKFVGAPEKVETSETLFCPCIRWNKRIEIATKYFSSTGYPALHLREDDPGYAN